VGNGDGDMLFYRNKVNEAPTLTSFAAAVASGNEDNQITVTFANLQNQGNEADVDGTVTAFVVKAVSTGTLKIGTSAATATAWTKGTNELVDDATHKAYWTPAADANGSLNAFTAVAKDNKGAESATGIQAKVTITAVNDTPALTMPVAITYTDTVFDDPFANVTGSFAASNVDGDTLTYGITGGTDNGLTMFKNSAYGVLTVTKTTGAYSFVPNDAAIEALTVAASVNFTVIVSDGLLINSNTLTIKIAQNGTTESLGNDTLTGTSGNDKFDGLAGADKMTGGLGNDTYTVDNVGDVVIETPALATEIDKVNSSISYTLKANVENLTLTGTAANGTGNALNNILTGNSGANLLNGGAGADKLIGGLGNDVYVLDDAGDVVIETSTLATEIDMVKSSISYTLKANVENLNLTGTAANGIGNGLNNILTGNTAANKLSGLEGNDSLYGGAGNDTLNGGAGNDILTGDAGKDIFQFLNLSKDTIKDFVVADDTIQLENSVFAKLTAATALNVANFKLGTAAADANDYVIYNSGTGALLYDADGNGIGAATQIAVLGVNLHLTNADFAVI